jgi:hypothetical protein
MLFGDKGRAIQSFANLVKEREELWDETFLTRMREGV